MTTTIRIETGHRPVAVTIDESFNTDEPETQRYGHSSTTHFVGPNDVFPATIYDGRAISVRELPEGATSLQNHGQNRLINAANQLWETAGCGSVGEDTAWTEAVQEASDAE